MFIVLNDKQKRCSVCGFICPIYIKEPIIHQGCHGVKSVKISRVGRSAVQITSKKKLTILRRLRFLPQFCISYLKYWWQGRKKSPLSLKVTRLNICLSCEEFYVEEAESCFACGCFVDIKAGRLNQKCPVGKW